MITTIEIGQQIGRWVILEKLSKNGRTYYKCKCSCGTIKEVRADHLKSEHSLSCGCLQKEIVSQNYIDLTNRQFGEWTVIEKTQKPKNIISRGTYWLCKCNCGALNVVSGQSLRSGSSQSCGCIKSRGENKISQILKDNGITFGKQFSFKDCLSKTKSRCFFDFIIYKNNKDFLLLEYNGKQHYKEENWGWESPKENDEIKKEYCNKNNIELVEVPYWDYDKIDWNYIKEICHLC